MCRPCTPAPRETVAPLALQGWQLPEKQGWPWQHCCLRHRPLGAVMRSVEAGQCFLCVCTSALFYPLTGFYSEVPSQQCIHLPNHPALTVQTLLTFKGIETLNEFSVC